MTQVEQAEFVDFSAQAEEVLTRPKRFLKSGIAVNVRVTEAKRSRTKADKPCVIITEALLENGLPSSFTQKRWLMLPFSDADTSTMDVAEKREHDEKLLTYQRMGVDYILATKFDGIEGPSYDRETKAYVDTNGNEISKQEFYNATKEITPVAKRALADIWRDPERLVGAEYSVATKSEQGSDGNSYIRFTSPLTNPTDVLESEEDMFEYV